ncbi:50S ribosome-binding GTPase [bacterium]|nr:50S ribosome-binding GTPase [bacterium]
MYAQIERPSVALIGRPNVGKSTLFNRLIGSLGRRSGRAAITDDLPGVTRDRLYGICEWDGYEFTVIDCGGIGEESADPLWEPVADNTRRAMAEADLIMFIVDARSGLTLSDEAVLRELRKLKKPVVVAVNKVDSEKQEMDASEFWKLGYTQLVFISAASGRNSGELLDEVVKSIDWSRWPRATPDYVAWRADQVEGADDFAAEEGDEDFDDDFDYDDEELEDPRDSGDEDDEDFAAEPGDEELDEAELGGIEDEDEEYEDEAEADSEVEAEPGAGDPAGGRPRGLETVATVRPTPPPGPPRPQKSRGKKEPVYPFAWAALGQTRFVPDESWRLAPIRLAFVGRQNVGKSSLTNVLLGEDRALVADLPGTTRDPLWAAFKLDGQEYELLDTAGMKRISRMKEDVDFYSLVRAQRGLRHSEVALLVLDAELGVTEQDKRVASRIEEEGRAVVIVINKADLITVAADLPSREEATREDRIEASRRRAPVGSRMPDPAEREMYDQYIRAELGRLRWAEVVYVSAFLAGGAADRERPELRKEVQRRAAEGMEELLKAARRSWENFHRRIDNKALQAVLHEAIALSPPPIVKNMELRFYDFRQIGNCPPTFLVECNNKRIMRQAYRRFIERRIRRHFEFTGTHIELVIYERRRRR